MQEPSDGATTRQARRRIEMQGRIEKYLNIKKLIVDSICLEVKLKKKKHNMKYLFHFSIVITVQIYM